MLIFASERLMTLVFENIATMLEKNAWTLVIQHVRDKQ